MKQVLLRWLPTRQCQVTLLVLAISFIAMLSIFGIAPPELSLVGMLPFAFFGDTAPVPGTDTQTGGASSKTKMPWRRIREKSPVTFQNVAAGATAYVEIPRYALTLLNLTMILGGTSFKKTDIGTIRVRLGSKVLWQFQGVNTGGVNLNTIQSYLLGNTLSFNGLLNPTRASILEIDFTDPRNRHLAGEMIGGIDMTRLPPGKLRIEVTILNTATAPAIDASITWGIPQNNALIKKYLEFPYLAGVAGRNSVPLTPNGAIISRIFFFYTAGLDWSQPAVAPLAVAWAGNVGNGTFGTITVNAGAQIGTYKVILLAATLAILQTPDGRFFASHIATGAAFNPAGSPLSFTLTAGGTAFTAGDGFDIVVSDVSDGNINRVEIKKNGRTMWDLTDHEARNLEQKYGQAPQSRVYVVDFQADNNTEGALTTQDAASLEFNEFVTTGGDQQTIYLECIDDPANN